MWWRSLALFVVGGVLGTGFGVALGFFLFPFVFPPPPAAERLTETDTRETVIAEGTFIHANPSDPVHWGKGSVAVRQDSVNLQPISKSAPAPNITSTSCPRRRFEPTATCATRSSSISAACARSRAASAMPYRPVSTSPSLEA